MINVVPSYTNASNYVLLRNHFLVTGAFNPILCWQTYYLEYPQILKLLLDEECGRLEILILLGEECGGIF